MKRRIRLGIIGCGGFVKFHLRTIAEGKTPFEVVALTDVDPSRAEKHAADFVPDGSPAIFADHAEMLGTVKPDAVVVSTPHTLHFTHGYDALRAGAHVMVEKPMVTDAEAARKLSALAKRKQRILQVAVQGTYTDTFAYARHLLTDGTIGELQLVNGHLAQNWLELTRGTWRQKPALSGGGQLYDSTAHVLSAMVYLVNSPVREAFCWLDRKGARVDINAVATIRFANGCLATVNSGGNCDAWHSKLVFQGRHALMEIGAHGGDFRVRGAGLKKEITAAPRGWKIKTVRPIENFGDAIRGKDRPRCGARIGIIIADLMDALYESAATNAPVKVTRRVPKE